MRAGDGSRHGAHGIKGGMTDGDQTGRAGEIVQRKCAQHGDQHQVDLGQPEVEQLHVGQPDAENLALGQQDGQVTQQR